MNQLLKKAIHAVEKLPKGEQDDIARLVLSLAGDEGEPEDIALEHLGAVLSGLAQADNGDFASDEEVATAFRRFG